MKRSVLAALLVLCFASTALAHFQMVYTPELALEKGKTLHFSLVFTHPFEAGHTMNMGAPQEFYVVSKKSEEAPAVTTDLKDALKPITWKSITNSGKAWEADAKIRSIGDYAFVLVPEPYYEGEEDIYIQQITKTFVNVAGVPTLWSEPLGLKTEILPLDKPYALWTGNVFRGVVLSEGKPVPGADIEVEYMNHEPQQDKKVFNPAAKATAPQDSFVTMGIKADANGQFAFGIPKAGFWGFCALGVGPDKTYKDKELSQDAVIWVKAVEMK